MDPVAYVARMLAQLARCREPGFSGFGLIVYAPPMRLPVGPLGDVSTFVPRLPIADPAILVDTLLAMSSVESPWHDGFHLLDGSTGALTHICQFFAPPIDALPRIAPAMPPMGARQAAAIAGSTLAGVMCTALMNAKGVADIFIGGCRHGLTG